MRKAFTLMELMVSIVLIVLITLFLFGAIASSKVSNDSLLTHTKSEQMRSELFELLYRDLLEALSIETHETKDRHFTILQMQTANSLYNIATPYVTYFVHSRTHQLTRLESARAINLPIAYEDENFVMADTLLPDVKAFNVYTARKQGSMTNIIESDEMLLPDDNNNSDENLSIEQNTTAPEKVTTLLLYVEAKALEKPLLFELFR